MGALDDYLATLATPARSAYERIRDLAFALAPDAEQDVSYGMAVLKYRDKPLLGFKAARNHLSVFPFSPASIEAVKGQLPRSAVSRGTVRFSAEQPLPDDVVRTLVRSRIAQIDETQ
ncbi:MAG TPA: DUF1801 domain-containing protein [Kineosporiaceae bacterium]|nr:DUF1801 domain-containing protein [Kineosporiaceae bacterium]